MSGCPCSSMIQSLKYRVTITNEKIVFAKS